MNKEIKKQLLITDISNYILENPQDGGDLIQVVCDSIEDAGKKIQAKINFVDLIMNVMAKKDLNETFKEVNQYFIKEHDLEKYLTK